MNMVLLGPPGAGKGTQAELLKKEYDLLHISTGNLLREEVKSGSKSGKEISSYMDKGELVPDAVVTKVVVDRMKKPDASRGIMLDGYPRTVAQAKSLDIALKDSKKKLDIVLYFNTSKKVAVERLSGRRVCRSCAKNYHVTNMPPAKEGVCDLCGGELYRRDDDNPETVINRLLVYNEKSKELVGYYKKIGILKEIDGDRKAAGLFNDIKVIFEEEVLFNDRAK